MRTSRIRLTALAAAALFGGAMAIPAPAGAVGMEDPAPSATAPAKPAAPDAKKKKPNQAKEQKQKKPEKKSEREFIDGYHAAYATIYNKGDYASGIEELRALGHDDNPDVATLLGYASRKLGRYDDAKFWYDKALTADPRHASTLSYYGMWHAEQGNELKAAEYLEKVRDICGTHCREYTELKKVMDGTATY
ncbi:MAG TPA: tetratricopeptide repeat protein [Xanthobacteraceae bacterium]|jgi:tetratricopeptide (TPR) repeat protein|nr:tetratricopeptide repeat protein [Xanthobacteraceae bacterium]